MTRLLKPALIATMVALVPQAWAVDAHQMVVPQNDGVAIEPQHRAHVLADPTRDFRFNRTEATWLVLEPSRQRVLMPDEEARLASEEAQMRADADEALHNRVTLHFPFNKSTPISWAPLESVIDTALTPTVRVLVVGHADEIGSTGFNQRLSEKRAIAVQRYLAAKGVDKFRVNTEGHGKREPVSPGDGSKNRRAVVDVILSEGSAQ
ncbi:OmpA family protein [Ralstonia pseudosolanacearum]|uniref:OmpA family protein n=1 Tax=Ralstonia pseudosolanacearum TaxID=1310165 RepID=UPI003CEA2C54